MRNVTILEGPDGAGKTMLAARLMLQGYHYQHEGPTPEGASALMYYGARLDAALRSERDTVLDRFHLGAYVYGPIFRRRVELSAEELTVFDRLAKARGVRVVVALPGWNATLANWAARRRHEMVKDQRQLLRIYKAFERVARERRYETWSYLTSPEPHRPVSQARYFPPLPAGAVGSRAPTYLLVGERANAELDLPFFSMRASSGYLNRALWRAGYREEQLALVNALDRHGERAHDDAIVRLVEGGVKRIITLGRVAHHVVDDLCLSGIEVNVPHPQFMKRFKHHEFNKYVRMLKKAKS